MKHILKKFSILIFGVLLLGCGKNNSEVSFDIKKDKNLTQYIHIGNQHWSIKKPIKWTLLESIYKTSSYATFAMEYRDQKFIIQQNQESNSNIPETIFNNAKNELFFFYPLEYSPDLWKYRGKLDEKTPIREFWQKIYKLDTFPYFLLGTCSFEYAEEKEHNCEEILESWQQYSLEVKSE